MTEPEDVVGAGKGKSDRETGTRLTATKKNKMNKAKAYVSTKNTILN